MKNKLIKALLIAIGLFLSPFIVIGILGGLYILFQVIGGASINEGYDILLQVINNLKPYFPYLTFGPVLLILVVGIIKKRKMTRKLKD